MDNEHLKALEHLQWKLSKMRGHHANEIEEVELEIWKVRQKLEDQINQMMDDLAQKEKHGEGYGEEMRRRVSMRKDRKVIPFSALDTSTRGE